MRVAVTLRPGKWDLPEDVPEEYFGDWTHTIECVAAPDVDDTFVFDAPGALAKYVASWVVVSRTIDATRSALAVKITCEPQEFAPVEEDEPEEEAPEDPDFDVTEDDDLPI